MLAGALLTFVGVLGIAFAALVLRADPRRWDNRVFAALGVLDAAITLARAVALLEGRAIHDPEVLRAIGGGSIAIAWLTVEFAYSFPFSRPLPQKWRAAMLLWAAATAVLFYHPGLREWNPRLCSWFYFFPSFAVMIALLVRNMRASATSADRGAVRLVVAAVALRWVTAMVAYLIGWPLGEEAFATLLWFEATASPLVGSLVITFAVLRSQLFSVRGVAAEVVVYAVYGVGLVGLTALGVEAVLSWSPPGGAMRALLIAVALIPAAVLYAGARLRPRLEQALGRVDPRRALRREVLDRVMRPDAAEEPEELVASIRAALGEITVGGEVRWLPVGAGLPEALAGELEGSRSAYLRRAPELPAELLVPVRAGRGRRLYGALAIDGGKIDRDALLAAVALADHLALHLENHRLFSDLEGAKRLATLGSFAAAIAHDLRTPLTSVTMNVQILRGKAKGKLADDDLEYFDIAIEELKRLNAQLQELLDYAKPVQLQAAPVDMRDVVDDAARGLEPLLAERKLKIERQHPDSLPAVPADAQRLRQVLWNLLDNAVRASDEGAAITLRTRVDGDRVAVDIADTGRGIADADLPRIFEPFFTTRADGTGLGLAICQKLVRAHRGEILVRSAPGKGSTFTVLLPSG